MSSRFYSLLAHPSLRRWADTILLATTAVVTLLALESPASFLLGWWLAFTSQWSIVLFYLVALLSSAFATIVLKRLGAISPLFTLETMAKFPPVWFASIIGAFALFAAVLLSRQQSYDISFKHAPIELIITLCAVYTGILAVLLIDAFRGAMAEISIGGRRKTRRSEAERTSAIANDEGLVAWILDESPIMHPADDLFGHRLPAMRIASFLLRESPSSIGIVGPYGSGKSSVMNLVEYYLEHDEELTIEPPRPRATSRVISCKVDGWGRVSGTVAQKILALAIEEVRKHADCLSILALPENYRQALAETQSPAGAVIAALLSASHDPIAQLAQLDSLLRASGIRLVILLEDLDRNIGDEIIRDEMPALLDRLRKLNQVSFVLAIGTERQFSDVLIRICDHVEAVA
jgi:hypothetical protein